MRPYDTRMLLIQALSEARHSLIRLRNLTTIARRYNNKDLVYRSTYTAELLRSVAEELENWLKLSRLDPSKVLGLIEVVRIARGQVSGLHPDLDLALDQLSSSLGHIYSVLNEGYPVEPDKRLVSMIVKRARERVKQEASDR